MKKIALLTFFLALISYSAVYCQNRSVDFNKKPFSDLLSMAKSQKKLIFMDAYADWCGPCKWMSANIFTNDTVADYFNKTFICAKFDMEKGEGIELSRRFNIKAYPTLLFIDGDGNMVHKRVGAPRQVKDYLEMGNVAITPGQGLAAVSKKYDAGSTDPELLMLYLKRLQEAYMPVNEPLAKYMAAQKESELTSAANWRLIYSYTEDMNSREFKYLVSNQENFARLYTVDSVDQKINDVYSRVLVMQTRSKQFSEENYNKTKQLIKESGYKSADKVIFMADINLYLGRNLTDKFLESAYSGVEKYYANDYTTLNSFAWQVFSMTDEDKYLQKAGEWAKRSFDLKSEAANSDTYAQILFKLGRKDEAIHYEKRAIELAKKEGIDSNEFEQTLLKMQ